MRALALLLTLLSLALGSCQFARGTPFGSGSARATLSGHLMDTTSTVGGVYRDSNALSLTTGAFATPDTEVGLDANWMEIDEGTLQAVDRGIGLYTRYWFHTKGSSRGWMEGSVGYGEMNYNQETDSNMYWGLGLGVTQFMTETGAIEYGFDYTDYDYAIPGINSSYAIST
ncbi:MAG: hypothetical protein MK213_10090, partial [Planctomycetes bacterium]|nr:hypothetical protein [Planctomycetota bacterium]